MGVAAGQDPTPRGGTPPPPQTPKRLHRTMGFMGAAGTGDFVLVLWQRVNFCFHRMCLYSKCSDFEGDFKYGKDMLNTFLPICFPRQISSPALSVGALKTWMV